MPLIDRDCDVIYKVLIVGDSGVGKTAILDCLMGRDFNESSRPTVGVDFVRKIVEADGALVQLRIWDTAGLEKFRSITRLQYRGVQGLIVVYDVTNETSFHSVEYWLSNIQHICGPNRHPYEPLPFLVVGNKSDVTSGKKISSQRGSKLAKREMAFGFYEISAKTGNNVYKAFHSLAFHITDISNPKLMKSYHPNFLRPMGVKPLTAPESNRMSAPCFSSTPTALSPRQRYSLWDPLIPWMPYNAQSSRASPRKSRVKRLTLALPFMRRKKKRKATTNRANETDFDFNSGPGTGQQNGAPGLKTKNARRHKKKRFRRMFRLKYINKDHKTKKGKKKYRIKKRKLKFSKSKAVKRRLSTNGISDKVEQQTKHALQEKSFRTRVFHFLCSCFLKQRID